MRRSAWVYGGAAAIVAALAGLNYRAVSGLVGGCGLPPFPPPRADNVTVSYSAIRSRALNQQVGIAIVRALPLKGAQRDPIVIFALPGRASSASAHVGGLYLANYLGHVVKRRATRPVVLIAVDSDSTYWHRRRNGKDTMCMLMQEIVEPNVHMHRASRARTGIMGWSMGGYGALLAAETYPHIFGAVCGTSVAVWRTVVEQRHASPDAFDDAADFERYKLTRRLNALKETSVRIACGTKDPFFQADVALADALRKAGVHAQVDFEEGCHDAAYWEGTLPANFDFMLQALT
jgi:esterase/lipase superfamily enzyme